MDVFGGFFVVLILTNTTTQSHALDLEKSYHL